MRTPPRDGSLGRFPKIRKRPLETALGGWGGRIRTVESGDAGTPAGRGLTKTEGRLPRNIQCRKGLDFRWQWSVSAAMPIRARLALLGSRPAGAAATVGLRW